MSSLFLDAKTASYRSLRAASQGASVSLLHACGEYVATFGCAVSIASALGTTATDEQGVPTYRIETEEMPKVCAKLAGKLSVALMEVELARFVCVWKIPCVPLLSSAEEEPVSTDPGDY